MKMNLMWWLKQKEKVSWGIQTETCTNEKKVREVVQAETTHYWCDQLGFHSPTVSGVSLRSVIILCVVWPPLSTPAGMPSSLPKSLSENVDASRTQRALPSSRDEVHSVTRAGSELSQGSEQLPSMFRKRNANVDLSHLPPYVMLFRKSSSQPILYHNYSPTHT